MDRRRRRHPGHRRCDGRSRRRQRTAPDRFQLRRRRRRRRQVHSTPVTEWRLAWKTDEDLFSLFFVPPFPTMSSHFKKKRMKTMTTLSTG